jgi:predicted dehydrogenase
MTYTAAIIGLGSIGMGYDKALPAETHVWSHARALQLHPDFELVGGVDPDPGRREEFAHSYGATAYDNTALLLDDLAPDIVVVASPTSSHGDIVAAILARHAPRAILCEKPLTTDSATAQQMIAACDRQKVPLYVNFIRRADPGVLAVKARLTAGLIAMPFKAIVWYSKGLLHNGSHFADLLTFWFGPIRAMQLIAPGRVCGEHDAEPDVRFDFDQGSAILCAAREEDYSHYTVEVVAANGRLRYEQGGMIMWQAAAPHPTLPGYRQLQTTPELIVDDTNRYQYHIATQLSTALRGGAHVLCDGTSAATTQQWLERAIGPRTTGETRHG